MKNPNVLTYDCDNIIPSTYNPAGDPIINTIRYSYEYLAERNLSHMMREFQTTLPSCYDCKNHLEYFIKKELISEIIPNTFDGFNSKIYLKQNDKFIL